MEIKFAASCPQLQLENDRYTEKVNHKSNHYGNNSEKFTRKTVFVSCKWQSFVTKSD